MRVGGKQLAETGVFLVGLQSGVARDLQRLVFPRQFAASHSYTHRRGNVDSFDAKILSLHGDEWIAVGNVFVTGMPGNGDLMITDSLMSVGTRTEGQSEGYRQEKTN